MDRAVSTAPLGPPHSEALRISAAAVGRSSNNLACPPPLPLTVQGPPRRQPAIFRCPLGGLGGAPACSLWPFAAYHVVSTGDENLASCPSCSGAGRCLPCGSAILTQRVFARGNQREPKSRVFLEEL